MQTIDHNAQAGISTKFEIGGAYFHLLTTTANVNIKFYRNGAIFLESTGIDAGYFAKPKNGFDAVEIYSLSTQSIKFAISNGEGGYNRTSGVVSISSLPVQVNTLTFGQSQIIVTDVSQVLLIMGASKSFLMIKNEHPTGNIWVNLSGAVIVPSSGFKIPCGGGCLILDKIIPLGGISFVGDIPSNINVVCAWAG